MFAGILASLLLLMVISVTEPQAGQDGVPVLVTRRPSGDSFQLFNDERLLICSDDQNFTYLVSDRICVKNQELFSDCGFTFIPGSEISSYFRLAISITKRNDSQFEQLKTLDLDNSTLKNASISTVNNTHQPVISSFCHIASLEVYRGRRQITEISHDGFSLSERGTVQIDYTELSYAFDEYIGELYRMNLSCFGGGLLEKGCLFFKLIGQANVSNAKFNMTVKGTFDNSTETDDNNSEGESNATSSTNLITINLSVGANESHNIIAVDITLFVIGGPLFYVTLGAASGVFILIVIVLILIVIVCCIVTDKRHDGAVTVHHPAELRLQGQRSLLDIQNPEFDTSVITDENLDSENVYSEVQPPLKEQQNSSASVSLKSNLEDANYQGAVALRRFRSLEHCLDVITFETFKPRAIQKKKRHSSWGEERKDQSTDAPSTYTNVKCEQEHIYDTVEPVAQGERIIGHPGYNKLSHLGYPMTSPVHHKMLLSASMYASLNIEDDGLYDVPRKSGSVHSLSDIIKKQERCQDESDGHNELMKTEAKFSSCLSLEGYYDTPRIRQQQAVNSTEDSSLYDYLVAKPRPIASMQTD